MSLISVLYTSKAKFPITSSVRTVVGWWVRIT
jgi:hypothetical protein